MADKNKDQSQVDRMLRTREARVLAWSLLARQAFLVVFITVLVLQLLGWVSKGIVAETDRDALGGLGLTVIAAGVIVYLQRLVRREKHLIAVGFGAVVLDIALIATLPFIWLKTVDFPGGSPAFLMKNELFALCIVGIVVNSMSLRPLYPALMSGIMIAMHAVIMLFVMNDPRVQLNWGFSEHFYSAAVNPGIFIIRMIILLLVGGFLSFLAWGARRNIRDAVALEVSNFEIREQQAQAIHEGKMAALSGLVAGVAHELNTPLGAAQSSIDTMEKCATKIAEHIATESDPSKVERFSRLMTDGGETARGALKRLSRLVSSLKDFVKLDESDVQPSDVRTGLESTLSLIKPEVKGRVNIVRDYQEVPAIECRPKELNQVFMTLMVNAFEAMNGEGSLHLVTHDEDDRVVVAISDSGPGIPTEKMSCLFEIGFSENRGRIAMGLGLPMARRIVERHGGTLTVESGRGEGASFLISLPKIGEKLSQTT